MTDSKLRALVLLADGAEEMEVIITVDVLRRAEIEVVLAGVEGAGPVCCSRAVVLVPDQALEAVSGQFDVIVLPGGAGGSQILGASEAVGDQLRNQAGRGGLIAAICAAPAALVQQGIGAGKVMTSHPSVRERVAAHAQYSEDRVVIDGAIVTSRGPGTSFEFALKLVEILAGNKLAQSLVGPMQLASTSAP